MLYLPFAKGGGEGFCEGFLDKTFMDLLACLNLLP